MSYICLIANEKGMVTAGDSRLTVTPKWLHLHFDTMRKTFEDQEQGLIWACCGLTAYAGVNYFRVAERILRDRRRSMGAKLQRIATILERVTGFQHKLLRQRSTFTLLLGERKPEGTEITVLDVTDGKRTLRTLHTPVALESGSGVGLGAPLPEREELEKLSLEEMIQVARNRVADAMERSRQRAAEQKGCPQTVGGNIRVVYLEP